MNFAEALKLMKAGLKVKRPNWGGYWAFEEDPVSCKQTIMMYTRDGDIINIFDTERPAYTLDNIAAEDFEVAYVESTPILGGTTTFDFGTAIKYMKRGYRIKRKGWNGKGIYLEMQVPDENSKMTLPYIYIVTTGLRTENDFAQRGVVPWMASQTDMISEDWTLSEGD